MAKEETFSLAEGLVILGSSNPRDSVVLMGKLKAYNVRLTQPQYQDHWGNPLEYVGVPNQSVSVSLDFYRHDTLDNLFLHPTVTPTMRSLALAVLQGDHTAALALADLVQESYLANP